ncbi:MAG: hypothetical protein V7700_19075 [Halioglobus sp.]
MKWLSLTLGRYQVAANPLRSERAIELAVVLLVLVLCFQLLYSGAQIALLAAPEAVAPAADALTVREIRARTAVSAAQSNEIRSRPLFWEGRRPFEQQVEVVAVKKPPPGEVKKLEGVTLQGVFGSADATGVIVRVKTKRRRILLGEEINGWTLQSVDANEVVFVAGHRTANLQLLAVNEFTVTDTNSADAGGNAAEAGKSEPQASLPEAEEEVLSVGGSRRR